MKKLDDSFSLKSLDNLENIIYISSSETFIYAYGTKEDPTLKIYKNFCEYTLNVLNNNELANSYFNKYSSDHIFMRTSTKNIAYGFNTKLFYNINESYYLYIKKYYGNIDIYRYNKELNFNTNMSDFCPPIQILSDYSNEYQIINNELVIVSGYDLFTLFNYDMAIYDFYIQKVKDSPYIQLNSKILQFNNKVKLLNNDKIYHIDFKLDHLIKLDDNFLEATVKFIDRNGTEYILNKNNRVIRDIKGESVTVETNKIALLYFYKKIPDNNEIRTIVFDKSQKGKNMKFKMTNIKGEPINIYLIKDFCFEGYFPMLIKNWENINTNNNNNTIIFIDNLYDKLETELLENENEKYIIYIFESLDENGYPIFNSKNYEIDEPSYFDNLLNPANNYNFGVIPGQSNGSIFLNTLNNKRIQFQFILYKNNEIDVTIENNNGYYNYYYQNVYPYKEKVDTDQILFYSNQLGTNSILSFGANNEFLFSYSYEQLGSYYSVYRNYISSIIQKKTNILQIEFPPVSATGWIKYFIVIIKKDDIKNNDSKLDIWYFANIISQNIRNNSIIIKELVTLGYQNINIKHNINISSLNPDQNTNLICTILTYDYTKNYFYNLYEPLEVIIERITPKEISLDEVVIANLEKKNYFKFYNKQEDINSKDLYLIFNIDLYYNAFYLYLMDDINGQTLNLNMISQLSAYTNYTLSKSGTFYLKFKAARTDNNDFNFTAFFPGSLIDIIEFSKNKYSRITELMLPYKLEPLRYKVANLKKDVIAFFQYDVQNNGWRYPNPFKICNDITNECTENIVFYNFIKDYNYTIYINFVTRSNGNKYYFPSYMFYSISEDNIEHIEKGYYIISEPKIYIIDLLNESNLTLYYNGLFTSYISYSNEIVSLKNINALKLEMARQLFTFSKFDQYKYGIIIMSPLYDNNILYMVIVNEFFNGIEDSKYEFIIKSNTNTFGLFYDDYIYNERPLDNYNVLTTISSPIKSLKYIASAQLDEKYNYIVQNYFPIPIYFDKYEKDYNIKIKVYLPRYSFTIVNRNDLLKIFISYLTNNGPSYGLYLEELFPLNLRINSDFNSFYEFLNLYLYDVKDKINIYITKYYGQSELFECNPDFIDKNDLSVITKPITLCKNKTSLFDKLYKLEATDFISR